MQVLLLCFLNCCCIKLGEMGVSILFVVLRVARQKRDELCMSTVSLMIYLTDRRANSMYLSVRDPNFVRNTWTHTSFNSALLVNVAFFFQCEVTAVYNNITYCISHTCTQSEGQHVCDYVHCCTVDIISAPESQPHAERHDNQGTEPADLTRNC